MITLITGLPGAGKTAALVSLLSGLPKDRPLFVHGVPDLKIAHEAIDGALWHEAPEGAIIAIDEAQTVFRATGAGSLIPQNIRLLETHRHNGHDLYLVTQHPRLIHSSVRALVGRHVHLRNVPLLGRRWYEWPEVGDPARFKTAPTSKGFRLPRDALGLYRSATEHFKVSRMAPRSAMLLGAALLVMVGLAWYVTVRIQAATAVPAGKGPEGSVAKLLDLATKPQTVPSGGSARDFLGLPTYPQKMPVRVGSRGVLADADPLLGHTVVWEGAFSVGGVVRTMFALYRGDERLRGVDLADLSAMGYSYAAVAPCLGVLSRSGYERVVGCGFKREVPAPSAFVPLSAGSPSGTAAAPARGADSPASALGL